jgi:hypothetical protein
VVCIHGANNACYLLSVLQQKDILQVGPTVIYVDSIAANMMVNIGNPTERSHHIGIQLFALLSWVKNDDVLLAYIKGTNNLPDTLTKSLGWVPPTLLSGNGPGRFALHHHQCSARLVVAPLYTVSLPTFQCQNVPLGEALSAKHLM